MPNVFKRGEAHPVPTWLSSWHVAIHTYILVQVARSRCYSILPVMEGEGLCCVRHAAHDMLTFRMRMLCCGELNGLADWYPF